MQSSALPSRRQFLKSASLFAATAIISRRDSARAAESDLFVRTPDPYNAEPPLPALMADPITPLRHFYVRNHGPMPKIDASTHKVRIEGMVQRPVELSLAELKNRFRQVSTEATLTCAGNRRQEMSAIKPVGGVQWDAGAIGHARWTGASLADVLKLAEIKPEARHVWFEGLDPIQEKDGSIAPFGGSIPLEKALAGDVPSLLAHAMNDVPLSAEHGFPVRTIVPGFIGARSVKWLTKITLSDRPSPNHYVAEAYKIVQSDAKEELAAANPIYGFPVNAAICSTGSHAGKQVIRGYALPSGETPSGAAPCTIAKVELSHNGGMSWTAATLLGQAAPFAWQHWTASMDLPRGTKELIVRATDTRGNKMPQRPEWNLKGYLYNCWHHVTVEVL